MKKLIIIFIPLLITSCNNFTSSKTKNIVELTNRLTTNSTESLVVGEDLKDGINGQDVKTQLIYGLSKSPIISEPVVIKGVIYVLDDKEIVTAFSKQDKKILWSKSISYKSASKNLLGGGIVHYEGKLFVTNGTRFVTILNTNDGSEISRVEFPDVIRTKIVILDTKVILVQTISNQLFTYDIASARFIWQHEGLTETLSSSNYVKPIVYNSNIIVSYSSGQVASLNAKNGEENWEIDLSTMANSNLPGLDPIAISCPPLVYGEHLYVASSTGKLVKISLNDGKIRWKLDAQDIQSMQLIGNSIFLTNNAKQIAAVSPTDGKVKWIGEISANESTKKANKAQKFFTPFVTKNKQGWVLNVVASNGELYSFQHSQQGLSSVPVIFKLSSNIDYIGCTCCGDIHLVNRGKVIFISHQGDK